MRPPTEEDVSAAVRLINQHWPEPIAAPDVLNDWTAPRLDLARDARIGDDVYALVEDIGEARAWIEVHGRAVAGALDWAELRARERGARRLLSGGWSTNATLLAELERRGYDRVRGSWRMEIALADRLSAAEPPPGIAIRTLRPGEERLVYEVHQETFEDTWEPMRRSFEDWSHWFLEPPRFAPDLWFVALDGDEVCGLALCHEHATIADLGWVAVLGVRRPWRRRGVGRALLLEAFHAFRGRGLARAGLGVDAEDGAHRLYESVGMRVAARFDIYEKELG